MLLDSSEGLANIRTGLQLFIALTNKPNEVLNRISRSARYGPTGERVQVTTTVTTAVGEMGGAAIRADAKGASETRSLWSSEG